MLLVIYWCTVILLLLEIKLQGGPKKFYNAELIDFEKYFM